jgi:aspartokinase/homoserine dehydrogenase 1
MAIFTALAKAGSNVIMISQASSEHSVCVVVRESEADTAVRELTTALARGLETRSIQSIDIVKDLEILSAIGANMRGRPGVAGKLFTALGQENINILAIAQGSGEMNISCVIESKDRNKALNAVHSAFFPEV